MTSAGAAPFLTDRLAAFIKGDDVPWSALGVTSTELLEACGEQDLTGLVRVSVSDSRGASWPQELRDELARAARAEAATELLRQREIASVLDALASHGVHAILFKGTALAYSVYSAPALRPRCDTDLLVRHEQIDSVRRAMSGLGYVATTYCDGELLFCQFEVRKRDQFGVDHAFDFHWKISTQSVFADLLIYDELAADAVLVPALGRHARAAGLRHALLIACVHPTMHHRNIERLIWTYDIHLLASQLSDADFEGFAKLAVIKRVGAICVHQLALARSRFGTAVPDCVTTQLAVAPATERSAAYLDPDRRWHDELVSSLRGLSRWKSRFRLLREVLFPSPQYILGVYGLTAGPLGAALLPVLYLHRGLRGASKVLLGRK